MSSVTRLHLLSQSTLNVSCQKQKQSSSLPTESLAGSPMEFVGRPSPSGACNLLGVPGLISVDVDDDEGDIVIGIRPKSSPLPRRKSSLSDEDSEPVPPLCGSRRVSFADAKGLNLVQVKEFGMWDIPMLPEFDSSDRKDKDSVDYFISLQTFSLPLPTEELCSRVRDQKVELETLELLPGTTIVKGVIRVLNISFDKAVYVRTSLDSWSSHFDLLAEYIPDSSDGVMDCFSFKITLIPPFGEQGAKVDFCLRYDTPMGTFWANNNNRNYVLSCHKKTKEERDKPPKETLKKKSCLKMVGQNFSTAEDISETEDSNQENKPDVSKHAEAVGPLTAKQISDSQPETAEEDGQQILTKSRRNSSRRSRRKAARMARMRDYFAQRNGEVEAERDESPLEVNQAAPEENVSDFKTFSEEASIKESSQMLSGSLETRSKTLNNVPQDMPPAHDSTSDIQTETSESINLADLARLARGESASDILDKTPCSNDESAPLGCQNTNKDISPAEDSQKDTVCCECNNDTAEPKVSAFAAVSSENSVSQSNSVTFGTVVAPLYHQVFGKTGADTHTSADEGVPVKAAPNVKDFTHTEEKGSVSTEANTNTDKSLRNVDKTLESSNQESLDVSPNNPSVDEEISLNVTPNDILISAPALQDFNERHSSTNTLQVLKGDSTEILDTAVLDLQISTERADLQGGTQEDNLLCDLQITAAEEEVKSMELTCTQTTELDQAYVQSAAQDLTDKGESSTLLLQPSQSELNWKNDKTDQPSCSISAEEDNRVSTEATKLPATATSEDSKSPEALYELNPHYIAASDTKGSSETSVCCVEMLEANDLTTPQISPETNDDSVLEEEESQEVKESHNDKDKEETKKHKIEVISEVAESAISDSEIHRAMIMEQGDDAGLERGRLGLEEEEPYDLEDFCSGYISEIKNWEMMVEEEEINILTAEEEGEGISLEAGDIEAIEEDHEEQSEDAGTETGNLDTKEDTGEKMKEELMWEIIATKEKKDKAGDVLQTQRSCEEEIWGIVAGKDNENNSQNTKIERAQGEEELTQEADLEKDFKEVQEVETEESSIQGGEKPGAVEKPCIEQEHEAEIIEESINEEKYIIVDTTGDAESKSVKIEDIESDLGCLEERLESTQKEVGDDLSASVSNVLENTTSVMENTEELDNQTEEDFQRNKELTQFQSKAERYEDESNAAEDSSCLFVDDPEDDQIGQNSNSSESDSDDEVELYMHCLRAVHVGEQAQKDKNKETGFGLGKRPSVNRSKLMSTPMPSISESLDEDQHVSCLQDSIADIEIEDFQPSVAALPEASEQESVDTKVSWWRETFSCHNIGKALLFAISFVIFLVVAYHYDFIACFGLYLISLVWLWFQGERQPVKNRKRVS